MRGDRGMLNGSMGFWKPLSDIHRIHSHGFKKNTVPHLQTMANDCPQSLKIVDNSILCLFKWELLWINIDSQVDLGIHNLWPKPNYKLRIYNWDSLLAIIVFDGYWWLVSQVSIKITLWYVNIYIHIYIYSQDTYIIHT